MTIQNTAKIKKLADRVSFLESANQNLVTISEDGTRLFVNGQEYIPASGSDDQQITIENNNIVLEDGGSIPGQVCKDLAGNDVGIIIQP